MPTTSGRTTWISRWKRGCPRTRFAHCQVRAPDWTAEECTLLDAVDELHGYHTLTDKTWNRLARFLSTDQLITLPMLVGQYTMLAGTLNALHVTIDDDVDTSQRMLGWGER